MKWIEVCQINGVIIRTTSDPRFLMDIVCDGSHGKLVAWIENPRRQGLLKPRLHYQSFLVQENLVKVFDANFDSLNGQRKLLSKSIKELSTALISILIYKWETKKILIILSQRIWNRAFSLTLYHQNWNINNDRHKFTLSQFLIYSSTIKIHNICEFVVYLLSRKMS